MVVEGVSMAATNTLSTANARGIRRRGGGGRQSGFQGQQQREQDLVRLYSGSREQRERSRSTSEFVNTKDSCRWKKVNRTPKMKQCKLDVRREQWLCQPSQDSMVKTNQDKHGTRKGGERRQQQQGALVLQEAHSSCAINIDAYGWFLPCNSPRGGSQLY
jgi:hypothetical protein